MRSVANTIIALSLLMNACGKSDQKVQTVSSKGKTDGGGNSSGDATIDISNLSDPNCTSAASCNAITFTVNDEMSRQFSPTDAPAAASSVADPSAKQAVTGTAIAWTLTATVTTAGAPAGRVLLAPQQVPTWIQRTSTVSTAGVRTQNLAGAPGATDVVAAGYLVFIARDMVKCKVTATNPTVTCLDATTAVPTYDKYISIPYTVTAGAGGLPGSVPYPTVYPIYTPVPTPCIPGQTAGGILGGLAGSLFGGLGSTLGGLLGGMASCS